jgi:hypothetical protein
LEQNAQAVQAYSCTNLIIEAEPKRLPSLLNSQHKLEEVQCQPIGAFVILSQSDITASSGTPGNSEGNSLQKASYLI